MQQNPFSDLNDNEQRLTIERNVEQRLSEIEVQMQRVAEDTQEFQRLQTEKEVLEGIRMPDELRKALESDPQALELEIQTQLVRDNDLYNIPGTPPDLMDPPKGDAFALRSAYAMKIDHLAEPPMFKVSDTHYAATWLLHPLAPKIERPVNVGRKKVNINE